MIDQESGNQSAGDYTDPDQTCVASGRRRRQTFVDE